MEYELSIMTKNGMKNGLKQQWFTLEVQVFFKAGLTSQLTLFNRPMIIMNHCLKSDLYVVTPMFLALMAV